MGDFPDLPHGNLPSVWADSYVIECLEGTRWFVERGTIQAFRHWLDELQEANPGDLIPMQWAPQYVGVSRPAIRKRALAGKLTVFSFALVEPVKTLLGRVENRESRTTFDYLVRSECEAWRDELFEQREDELAAYLAERDGRAARLPKGHRKRSKKA